eukprot:TRINITY_DN78594_c0_g1_i1.p1 TRINITY_DN78594_c0_g1~~TRINITY_DN78594_c0_g1_i1.p1  ORF type:complete len:160 (-),score=12.55 TRINITY_DN78594_c0_g1_i1:31-510(-)
MKIVPMKKIEFPKFVLPDIFNNLKYIPLRKFIKKEEDQKLPIIRVIGAEEDCSIAYKNMILRRIKHLVAHNLMQDVHVTRQNISTCSFVGGEYNRFDAIMSFNGEKCTLSLTHVQNNGEDQIGIINENVRGDFSLTTTNETHSCFYRLATRQLQIAAGL